MRNSSGGRLMTMDPREFKARLKIAMLGAVPWMAMEAKAEAEACVEAWEKCGELAVNPDLLNELDVMLSRLGLVGERSTAEDCLSRRHFPSSRSTCFSRAKGTV